MAFEENMGFVLETERLILRPFRMDDLDLIQRLYGSEQVLKYTPFDTLNEAQAERHLEQIVSTWGQPPRYNYEMAVILKETEARIGRAHIEIDQETDTGMIGWFLIPEYCGHGYATEMTPALIECCFGRLHLHRVNAVCNPKNEASWHVLEKCGMRREALLLKKCRYIKGGITSWEDELEYAILSSEWKRENS